MRLLKLGIYHYGYLHEFCEKRSDLQHKSYAFQHQQLIEDCFGSSDFWTKALTNLNYETIEIIANAEFLQRSWALENDFDFDDDWLFKISKAQIKKYQPDVLLVADYSTFTAEFLRDTRKECPQIRLVLGWCGAPFHDTSVFKEWDAVLSCIPEHVVNFKKNGHQSFHINHAFAPKILDKLDLNVAPSINFSFSGSILKRNEFHVEREKILVELIRKTDLQIWSDINQTLSNRQKAKADIAQLVKNVAHKIGISESRLHSLPIGQRIIDSTNYSGQLVDKKLAIRTKQPVFGLKMFQHLRDCRVALNTHIDISSDSASNMRLFEATGVGTCLITDWKKNIANLFQPDSEVLTYRTADECAEKVNYILENEQERLAIAKAGQKRTISEHTFDNRAILLDEIIKKLIA